jgi:uncharacterized protein (TIGR00725 family)
MKPYVAVCGSSAATPEEIGWAREVGRLLAEAGAVVVTGGLGGVMAAAAEGAASAGGTSIGLLPGDRHGEGNEHNTVVVPTGMGEARNTLVVRAAHAVIAVGGEFGTLSEIAFALRTGKPVVALGSWESLDAPVHRVETSEEAVRVALSLSRER